MASITIYLMKRELEIPVLHTLNTCYNLALLDNCGLELSRVFFIKCCNQLNKITYESSNLYLKAEITFYGGTL